MADGLSSADLRRQAAAGTMVRNGTVAKESSQDPLDEAMANAKKVTATKLIQQQTTSVETEAIKAETERIRAELDRQQLLAQTKAPAADEGFREFLFAQIQAAQDQAREAQQQANDSQRALLQERLTMLNQEMEQLRGQAPPTVPSAAELMEQTVASVEAAEKLIAKVRPPTPGDPRAVSEDFEIRRIQAEAMLEEHRIAADLKRQELQMELRLREMRAQKEEARLDEQNQTMGRFVNQYLPKIIELGQNFYMSWSQRASIVVPGPAVAPGVAPMAAPLGTPPPADLPTMTCGGCGQTLYYARGQNHIVCPHCFTVYSEESPAVEEGSGASGPSDAPEVG